MIDCVLTVVPRWASLDSNTYIYEVHYDLSRNALYRLESFDRGVPRERLRENGRDLLCTCKSMFVMTASPLSVKNY